MRPQLILLVPALVAAGCGGGPAREVSGGAPDRGAALIEEHGCGACHTIPGIENADADVGPRLSGLAARRYIAGNLANTEENVIAWIRSPQQFDPRTAMPDLGLSRDEARDIAAYLYCCTR